MAKDTVIHYGYLAGVPYYYSLSLREAGIKSKSIAPFIFDNLGVNKGKESNRKLPTDEIIYNYDDYKIIKLLKTFKSIIKTIRDAKVIHFYGGSLLPFNLDLFIFKMFKIPMIITWGGTDIRVISMARKNNKFFYQEEDLNYDNKKKEYLKKMSKYIDVVATDAELAEYSSLYFKKIFINKQPCSFDISTTINENIRKDKLILLHIPTRKSLKGTQYFIEATKRLKSEGYEFEFLLLEPSLTQKEMQEKISSCDIYLDQLRCGTYGMTAVEAIALGKPTLTYIRDDLISKYPVDLPFVNANPENVYEKLKFLLDNEDERLNISKKGHLYALKYHSRDAIKTQLIDLYATCGVDL